MTVLPCPACGAPLTGQPHCPACGLTLSGSTAAALGEVDQELSALGSRREVLLVERARLLAELRGAPVAAPAAARPAPPARPPAEWTPQRVQNVLLSLGALLLAVAAIVFTVVAWGRLGIGGRAAVLAGVTAVAAAVPRALLRRRLPASAEAVAAIALALGVVDLLALRLAGLAAVDDVDPHVYWAGGSALLAAAAAAYARALPVRVAPVAACALLQVPGAALATGADTPSRAAVLLAAAAAGDVTLWVVLQRPDRLVRAVLLVAGTLAWAAAAVVAAVAVFGDAARAGAVPMAMLAGVGVGAALVAGASRGAPFLAAATVAGATAAIALGWPDLDAARPVLVAAAALAAAATAHLIPSTWRAAVAAGATVVGGAAALAVLDTVVGALVLPVVWVDDAWPTAGDRAVLPPQVTSSLPDWTGAATGVVALLALGAAVALAAVGRRREAVGAAGGLAVVALAVAPLDLELGLRSAVAAATALALVLLATPAWRGLGDRTARAVGAVGVVAAARAAAWSLGDQDTTLVVLPVLAAGALVGLTRRSLVAVAAGVAAVLAAGEVAALGAAANLAADQVGALLVTTAALLFLAAELPSDPPRAWAGLLSAGAVTAGVGYGLAAADPGWLSWTLAGGGLVGLAVAARRPSRRWVALVGAGLLTLSSWVRLADAGVETPEAYAVPPGLVGLALGHLRRRAAPATGSFSAYGPGLVALLVPSLLASLDDDDLLRPALLGAGALAVVLLGARARLRAPLVLGGGTLLVLAVDQIAPYAAELPRWVLPAVAGLLLVTVGVTYEQRLRDLERLRRELARFV